MNPPNPTVAVTDWTFPDLGIEQGILKSQGVELVARQCKTEADLIELCAEASGLSADWLK